GAAIRVVTEVESHVVASTQIQAPIIGETWQPARHDPARRRESNALEGSTSLGVKREQDARFRPIQGGARHPARKIAVAFIPSDDPGGDRPIPGLGRGDARVPDPVLLLRLRFVTYHACGAR